MDKIVFNGKVLWRNHTYEVSVIDDNNFDKLKNITQVYGFIFDENGRILIMNDPTAPRVCLMANPPRRSGVS
ncbi:MAG: hypothetical protein AABY02_01395 [Nanoarchaeota archaeon]